MFTAQQLSAIDAYLTKRNPNMPLDIDPHKRWQHVMNVLLNDYENSERKAFPEALHTLLIGARGAYANMPSQGDLVAYIDRLLLRY